MIIARVIAEPAVLSAHCDAVVHALESQGAKVHGADPLPGLDGVLQIMADDGEPASFRSVLDRHFGATDMLITDHLPQVPQVFVSDALIDYVQALVAHTRDSSRFEAGLSPRAGLALLRAAQSHALVSERKQVLPEDVQAVIPAVVGHRLRALGSAQNKVLDPAQEMIRAVAIP